MAPTAKPREQQRGLLLLCRIDTRVDDCLMESILRMASGCTGRQFPGIGLIQWIRADPDEEFGFAEFSTGSAAYKASKALNGLNLFGKEIVCIYDMKTAELAELWRFGQVAI